MTTARHALAAPGPDSTRGVLPDRSFPSPDETSMRRGSFISFQITKTRETLVCRTAGLLRPSCITGVSPEQRYSSVRNWILKNRPGMMARGLSHADPYVLLT